MKTVPLIKLIHLNRITSIVLSLFALFLMATSCNDKPGNNNGSLSMCEEHPAMCKSVIEAKDFFVFKMGSYWVYEEETTHERDSLYVIQYANDTNGYDFYVKMQSSLTDYVYTYWPTYTPQVNGCSATEPVYRKCIYINRAKGKFQDNLGESQVFFVNYKIGEYITSGSSINYCQYNHVTIGEILDQYSIGTNSFSNVVRIDQDCEYAEGKQPTKFYYSKNVGIIRKELIDSNQVWNLVNYYVIQ